MIKNFVKVLVPVIFFYNSVSAEIIECRAYNPLPGKGPEMITMMTELATIQEANDDVVVNIAVPNIGGQGMQFDYCVRWDDQLAWAKSKDASDRGEDKGPYEEFAKNWPDPLGTQITSISARNLDSIIKAEKFNKFHVYHYFVLKAELGRHDELVTRFKQYEKLVEKIGVNVELYEDTAGGTGELHVLMTADSWTALVESANSGAGDKAWESYIASADSTMYQVVKEINGRTIYPAAK